MTRRKPPGMKVPDWIELQIRDAERQGVFENLPGKGKPIPDIDKPRSELEWLTGYLKRENVDIGIMLPPSLALAREVELLPETLAAERTQARVREIIEDLNRRIRLALLAPQDGPPMRVGLVDVDAAVSTWIAHRRRVTAERLAQVEAAQAAAQEAAQAQRQADGRRRARRPRLPRRRGPQAS